MAMLTMPRLDRVVLDHEQEKLAHKTGVDWMAVKNSHPTTQVRQYNRALNYHEMISEKAEGYGAQIAVALHFGVNGYIPDPGIDDTKADVGNNIEVKHTKHEAGHLIIQNCYRSPERLKDVAILVIGKSPVYYLIGWMPVAMAIHPKYKVHWDDNYWVPQRNLFEMKYLKRSDYGDPTL
jgi:hypothetical protein